MTIELEDGQHAEPNECGSCQYYKDRHNRDSMGICHFRFPPWVRKRGDGPKDLNEVDPRTVRDTDGCSLYVARNVDGRPAQFVQRRYWEAGKPSR